MKALMRSASLLILAGALASCSSTGGGMGFNPVGGMKVPGTEAARNDIEGELKLASAAMAGGDKANAIRIYRRLAADYPLATEPRIRLGEALLASGAAQEAARAYEGALNLSPRNYEALTGLARVQLALRQPSEALRLFEDAARQAPSDALIRNGRAVAYDQLGEHEKAQSLYLSLLKEDPSNIKVRSNYALSLALTGRLDESADILSGLAAAPDADRRIRQNLALAYGLAGNDGQAAHIARMDLDEEAVQANLEFYQSLRTVKSSRATGAALSAPSGELPGDTFKGAAAPGVPVPDVEEPQKTPEKKPAADSSDLVPEKAAPSEQTERAERAEAPPALEAREIAALESHPVPEEAQETPAKTGPTPQRKGLGGFFARLLGTAPTSAHTDVAGEAQSPVQRRPAVGPAVAARSPQAKVEVAGADRSAKSVPDERAGEGISGASEAGAMKGQIRTTAAEKPATALQRPEIAEAAPSAPGFLVVDGTEADANADQNETHPVASNLQALKKPAVPAVM